MLDFLIALSDAGQALQALTIEEDTSSGSAVIEQLSINQDHLEDARELATAPSTNLWQQLQAEKVVLADVARAFSAIFSLAPRSQRLLAGVVYTTILKANACPVRIV